MADGDEDFGIIRGMSGSCKSILLFSIYVYSSFSRPFASLISIRFIRLIAKYALLFLSNISFC
jgi:hypothetical protein